MKMKKRRVALFVVLLISTQCFSSDEKSLEAKQQNYQELIDAIHTHKKNVVVDRQPGEEVEEERKCCVCVNRCVDVYCERYVKATLIACAFVIADKAIFLGFI
jgi:hypothetical protein